MTLSGLRRSRLRFVTVTVMMATYVAMLCPPIVKKARADVLGPGLGGVDLGAGGSTSLAQPTSGAQQGAALAGADLATGTARTSFPFQLPKARGEAQPSLGLHYNSSAGLGFAGMGWTLDVPSIVRRGKSGLPRFTDTAISAPATLAPGQSTTDLNTDDYYVDGRLLIPTATGNEALRVLPVALLPVVPDQWAAFRAEVDDGARYFFNGQTWIQQTKSGHLIQFGYPLDNGAPCVEVADANTVKSFPQPTGWPPNPIYRWNLARDTDASGNTVYYTYNDEHGLFPAGSPPGPGIQYLTDIYDTSTNLVSKLTAPPPTGGTFAHHTHLSWALAQYPVSGPQPASGTIPPYAYSPIWRALPYAQLSRVDVTSATFSATDGNHRQLVRSYQLSYVYNDTQTRAYLSRIQPAGDCLAHGGPFVEGADGTLNAFTGNMNTCAQQEKAPASTYTYYGISPTPPSSTPPFTFATQPAYPFATGPGFNLIDLDGNAVPELVTGNLGFGESYPSSNGNVLVPACKMICMASDLDQIVSALGFFVGPILGALSGPVSFAVSFAVMVYTMASGGSGIFGPPPAGCSPCAVNGPRLPGSGTSLDYSQTTDSYVAYGARQVIHSSVDSDDAMWMFAIPGDWASTGRMSILYSSYLATNPWYAFNPSPSTPTSADSVRLGQFAQSQYPWTSLPLSLPAADAQHVAFLNGTTAGPIPSAGSTTSPLGAAGLVTPANAADVDGDGLPDIDLIGSNGFYSPYLSTRDREGTTVRADRPQVLRPKGI